MKTIAQQLGVKDFPFRIKDKNGNQIYFESSRRYWSKWEYDKNGDQIYYENSTGFWYKREYDERGNQIYYENSNGFWCKSKRDENGNIIYYEDSNGYIIDNRPKPCENKVVEIDGVKYELKPVK